MHKHPHTLQQQLSWSDNHDSSRETFCDTYSGLDEIASGDLLLIKIHTVFEGHRFQSTQKLKRYLVEKGITMPVGVDRHLGNDDLPETKKRYQTRGTPEIVTIDREGMIRFQQFGGFDPAEAEAH